MSEVDQRGAEKETSGAVSETELDQIINEIQSLQVAPVTTPASDASTLSTSNDEPWLEETLAQLKDDEVSAAAVQETQVPETQAQKTPAEETKDSTKYSEEEIATAAAVAAATAAVDAHESERKSMPAKNSKSSKNGENNLDGLKSVLGENGNEESVTGSVLEMTIRGKMAIKLNQGDADRVVTLRFDSECLHITLSDGMEFKIPHKQAV